MITSSHAHWRDSAACRRSDPELFFPEEDSPRVAQQIAAAKVICARCPVRQRCLDEALDLIPHGIAGGLTEQERRSLQRRPNSFERGLPIVASTSEAIDVARAATNAGEERRVVARHLGVTPRTVERWIGGSDSARAHTDHRTRFEAQAGEAS